jgi:hypothetical protein
VADRGWCCRAGRGILLQALLAALTAAIVYRTARLRLARPAAAGAALAWIFFTSQVSLSGQEFAVHALGFSTSAYLYLRYFRHSSEPRPGPGAHLALGLALSVTLLARLDTIALSLIVIATLASRAWRQGRLGAGARHLYILAAPVAVTVAAYAIISLALVGHVAPVSGAIKRTWAEGLLAGDPIYGASGLMAAKVNHLLWPLRQALRLPTAHFALGTYGVLALAGGLALRRRVTASPAHTDAAALADLTPFVIYSAVTFATYSLVYHGHLSYPPHYYVVQPWLAALLTAWVGTVVARRAVRRSPSRRPGLAVAVLALVLTSATLASVGVAAWRTGTSTPYPLYDAAEWIAENTPPGARVGAWNAGVIGYRSGRTVINLDGLVNSWDYFETDQHDLCGYWQRRQIDVIVDIFDVNSGWPVTPTGAPPAFADCLADLVPLWSVERDQTFWRTAAYARRPSPF